MPSGAKSAGAGLFAATGLGSSFILASCCAIPMGLSAIGLGASWLVPLVPVGTRYGGPLTIIAAVSIILSLVWVSIAARTCGPGDLCARRGFRLTIYGAALISASLLAASCIYE